MIRGKQLLERQFNMYKRQPTRRGRRVGTKLHDEFDDWRWDVTMLIMKGETEQEACDHVVGLYGKKAVQRYLEREHRKLHPSH